MKIFAKDIDDRIPTCYSQGMFSIALLIQLCTKTIVSWLYSQTMFLIEGSCIISVVTIPLRGFEIPRQTYRHKGLLSIMYIIGPLCLEPNKSSRQASLYGIHANTLWWVIKVGLRKQRARSCFLPGTLRIRSQGKLFGLSNLLTICTSLPKAM